MLRAILCKNQGKWEMKNFDPPSNFACNIDIVRGCLTMFGLLLATCHGNTNCLLVAKNLIFNLFLKSIKTLQPKNGSRYNTIILVYIGVHCS